VVARLVVELLAVRTALKLAIVIAALAAVAWSGVFVTWDFRIRGAIRELQYRASLPARQTLRAAGCRALPYLVTALNPSRPLTLLADVHRVLLDGATDPDDALFLKARDFEVTDTIDVRTQKCREIQEWWQRTQTAYHQPWRIWSAKCRS
jgi:hypothetical protein